MGNSKSLDYTPRVQEIDIAKGQAKELSSEIYDALGLQGQVSKSGPGVSPCDQDPEVLYKVFHPWSVWGVSEQDMERSMQRLKDDLPRRGWKVVEFGPGNTGARYLELTANSTRRQFSVNITFIDARRSAPGSPSSRKYNPSGIRVHLTSACFRVPEGNKIDQY
ncbi:hypothetical protein GCM10010218_18440 [Streptomyces mashuensis]|uniref:Uncharacterized protein n=1 Tax=Streptomyces mashuensis TaxID=33904 RepID=A0A919B142_9ACTN|nr:hypothetical protein GCM10010218_18440 [Streptomyces mashuensis]